MITSFDLSFTAVDILSQGLGINCRVFPFQLPSVGQYLEDRVRIAAAVRDDLHRRGLARGGDLAREVESALRLLGGQDTAIAVLGNTSMGGALYARAAMAGGDAAVVVKKDQVLRFSVVRPEALIHSVVQLLPPAKAGPGQSVSITQTGSAPPPDAEAGFTMRTAVRAPRTSADAQLRMATDILRRPRLGDGYFVVTHGSRRAPGLSWTDTDAGRYLSVTRTDDRGDTHVTYSPADSHRVAHKLGELVDGLLRTR